MFQDLMMLTALNVMLAKEASSAPLPVSLRDGQAYVAAPSLEAERISGWVSLELQAGSIRCSTDG